MRFLTVLFTLMAVALMIFNIRVTVLIFSSKTHSRTQKIFQLLFVWLVPFVGAVVAHYVHIGKPRKLVESWGDNTSIPLTEHP